MGCESMDPRCPYKSCPPEGHPLLCARASFDTRFLNAALARHGYAALDLPVVDTAAVARRVLRDEVRNCRLSTLAIHVRSRTRPEHRALPDARATVDVLHYLLERVGSLGATTLEDLRDYTRSTTDRAYRKVSLVAEAPERPGVYRFHATTGEVLYVGRATNLKQRLRQYFGQDRRRRIADLVRDTDHVTWTIAATQIEAAVLELREIRTRRPHYNRRSRFPDKGVWIKLTAEAFPRLSIVSSVRDDDGIYVGPVGSRKAAARWLEAVHGVSHIRQCTPRLRVTQDHGACVLKDLGRCGAPCDGSQSRDDYAAVVADVRGWLTDDPGPLVDRLSRRMLSLAADQRFEDAAVARARLHLVVRTLERARRLDALVTTGEVISLRRSADGDEVLRTIDGRLVATLVVPHDQSDHVATDRIRLLGGSAPTRGPVRPVDLEELELVHAWLGGSTARLLVVEHGWASPVAGGQRLQRVAVNAAKVSRQVRRDRQTLTGTKVARRAG